MSKWCRVLFALAFAAVPLVAAAQETKVAEPAAKAPEAAPQPTLWPASELKWVDNPGVKGARHALLWGDPVKEAFGKLNRWPAGTEVPLHYHPFEVRGVMLEGTLTITPEGGAAKELGPGSYWQLPGRGKHTTTCKAGADCVFLTTSRLRYETRMATATK